MMKTILLSATAGTDAAAFDPSIGTVIVIGMLIVFSALAVIFLCMMLMERVFRPSGKAGEVRSPFDGTLITIVANGEVQKNTVAAIATDETGSRNEILSPVAGTIHFVRKEGETFKRGDILFTVDKEASK